MHTIFPCHRKPFKSQTSANPSSLIDKTKNLRFIQALWILFAHEASLFCYIVTKFS